MRPKKTAVLILLALLAGTAGCIYRMPVMQGNFLDPGQVAQLEEGMTRSQVAFLLGTPMVPTAFDSDRWDYFYYVKAGRKRQTTTRRLTVFFEEDKVARIEREG